MPTKKSYRINLRRIKLLLLDVDGVLTDGGIYFSESGDEYKRFNIHDGYGIVKIQKYGIIVGIITGRKSSIVEKRMRELGVDEIHLGVDKKVEVYSFLKEKYKLEDRHVAYMGDDMPDFEILERVGFSAAPSNAIAKIKKGVHYVCKKEGGRGAVREVIDLLIENVPKK